LEPRAWLVTSSAGTVTNIRTAVWGDAWVSVTLNTAGALERSEAYLPGWRATAVNDTTGKVDQLKVTRAGLIEKVEVPQGKWVIHFHYHAPYIEVSTAASAISIVLWLGVSSGLLIRKRKKRRTKVLT
jgi:UDP-2,3-diacylglucosamine pyrophosphatase LpxH